MNNNFPICTFIGIVGSNSSKSHFHLFPFPFQATSIFFPMEHVKEIPFFNRLFEKPHKCFPNSSLPFFLSLAYNNKICQTLMKDVSLPSGEFWNFSINLAI